MIGVQEESTTRSDQITEETDVKHVFRTTEEGYVYIVMEMDVSYQDKVHIGFISWNQYNIVFLPLNQFFHHS